MRSAEEIAAALGGKRSGKNWSCRCFAHKDSNASFSVGEGDKGVVFFCHAGCEQDAVIDALHKRGQWGEERKVANGGTILDFNTAPRQRDFKVKTKPREFDWANPSEIYDY